ncbi:neugrin [Palaemon carinicauda]|uniref:neugrin n=1 Tax=Palaemon carinicauda TaxID=392227 RepID=UPI0035B62CB9
MFLRGAEKTIRTGASVLQWYMNPIFFNRKINTATSQYVRQMRSPNRITDLSQHEMDDLSQYSLEDDFADASLEELQHHVSNLDSDAVKHQNFIQQKTIRQKYFKKYEPAEDNLLTWEMKEQLKYLHHKDPEQWTPEALSVAFPISPNGVQKLLSSKWLPENEKDIERHDRAVIAKWRKYTNGRLGSARILELLVKKRLGQDNENLPVPLMDQEKIMSILESLEFENEEKPKAPSASTEKKLRVKNKPKIRSGSFVSIIENYESQISPKEPTQKTKAPQKYEYLDVSSVIPSAPQYEGTYSKMRSQNSVRQTRKRVSKKVTNLITFEEFMKTKTNS